MRWLRKVSGEYHAESSNRMTDQVVRITYVVPLTWSQLAYKRLAEGETSEARQAFKRLVSCLQKAFKWLAEAY